MAGWGGIRVAGCNSQHSGNINRLHNVTTDVT